ncbi:MAG TPA: hypothetical protein VHP32_01850 [Ignavibacteria bacterium]|nr:hypothetical protein [Ignavibacteria bacterium]
MPNTSKGIATAEGSLKLNINKMFKDGCFQSGINYGNVSWTNGSSIGYNTCFKETEKYIRLNYTITDYYGNKIKKDYSINLCGLDSNLGKGIVYYFVCPVTYRLCRILYKAYGSEIFKSRFAYRNRIYYNCQTVSKRDYALQRYFDLKARFDKLVENNIRENYKGKKTRSLKRLENLKNKVEYFDYKRMLLFEETVNKFRNKYKD